MSQRTAASPRRQTAETALHWLGQGRAAVVARAVETTELGPGSGDDLLLVDDAATVAGSVFKGAANTAVLAEARTLLAVGGAQRLFHLTVSFAEATAVGLTCGGTSQVLLQRLDLLPAALWTNLAAGRSTVLVSSLASTSSAVGDGDETDPGLLVVGDGMEPSGSLLGTASAAELTRAAVALLAEPGASIVRLELAGDAYLLEAWRTVPRLLAVGTADLATALRALCEPLGWEVEITAELEPSLDAVGRLGPGDMVIVLEHRPSIATPVLAEALRRRVGYVGALGSRRTQQVRGDALRAAGLTEDEVARLHGPTGLDLGARTPYETAISIVAEILAERSGRDARPLRVTTTKITP